MTNSFSVKLLDLEVSAGVAPNADAVIAKLAADVSSAWAVAPFPDVLAVSVHLSLTLTGALSANACYRQSSDISV
jgi:hypothetical protein